MTPVIFILCLAVGLLTVHVIIPFLTQSRPAKALNQAAIKANKTVNEALVQQSKTRTQRINTKQSSIKQSHDELAAQESELDKTLNDNSHLFEV